ncbi:hypothetical protein [Actinokineospora sp. NBRC 105648]|uniref:WXG100 family type VII secretion target n=1 Tax=Actinokineospora sp. NBRC 105648 TaxID=3032206 RepID=UPI0024A1C7D9|nr:hypothetical protein [Actinokineospora sp. NBRC 105648]GLZ38546.1 hypothetical protein Acsp05_21700 [Actinokineospora sp. NBRC 105648]
MDGFRAEADRLADRAGRFDGLAEQVDAIHRELADRLGAAGACWGTDEVGRSFADVHAGHAEDTLSTLGGLPEQLGDVGGRFRATARDYRHGEDHNTTILGSADA